MTRSAKGYSYSISWISAFCQGADLVRRLARGVFLGSLWSKVGGKGGSGRRRPRSHRRLLGFAETEIRGWKEGVRLLRLRFSASALSSTTSRLGFGTHRTEVHLRQGVISVTWTWNPWGRWLVATAPLTSAQLRSAP